MSKELLKIDEIIFTIAHDNKPGTWLEIHNLLIIAGRRVRSLKGVAKVIFSRRDLDTKEVEI